MLSFGVEGRMRSVILCLALAGGLGGAELVNLGDRRLFVQCTGPASDVTVVLENGLGAALDGWKAVQAGVESFAKVCSYDRAGEGHSDKPSRPQTPDTVVADLHKLLELEKVSGPYVLVGASLGGIYVRHFALRYPDLTAGMVLVDSAHEEQYSHYAAISPAIAERYATQDGRFDRNDFLRAAGQLEPGQRLGWHVDLPLIVLEHKRLSGPPRTEADQLAVDWHRLQVDLAGRSRYGKLIEAKSGHGIAAEQPEIVVESIRDVIAQARLLHRINRRAM
jgi:pimeloyl-ACP methyl ester carboxylesterase